MLNPLTSTPILSLNLQIYNCLYYEQDNPKYIRYPTAANVFIYIYLNNTYQIGLLKTGGGGGGAGGGGVGLFNC